MTKALYDLIGAERSAGPEALRAAYTRTVAQLVRRRRVLVEQGGDTGPLDLERARADEAWEILSDPVRRRRYDALLSLDHDGELPRGEALWTQVVGSLASPVAASAVDVVRALTHLQVGQLPGPADRSPEHPTAADASRAAPPDTQADVPTQAAEPRGREMPDLPSRSGPEPVSATPPKVVAFSMTPSLRRGPDRAAQATPGEPSADPQATPSSPGPRVPAAGQVVRIPAKPMPAPNADSGSGDDAGVDVLIAEHGWSGALLREVRERQGKSLRDIGAATRISARYLDAIEQDEHAMLPSATFVKGYLREIARTLGLDEAALVQGYMRRME